MAAKEELLLRKRQLELQIQIAQAKKTASSKEPEETGFLEDAGNLLENFGQGVAGEVANIYQSLPEGTGTRMLAGAAAQGGRPLPQADIEAGMAAESSQLPLMMEQIQQAQAENTAESPIAGTVGSVGGIIAPYLNPGAAVRNTVMGIAGKVGLKNLPKTAAALGMVAEGAAVGAGMAEEGERLEGAKTGALWGGAFPLVGAAGRLTKAGAGKLGALGSKIGGAKVSDDAQDLISGAMPVPGLENMGAYQALEPGVLRDFYGQIVANIPGIGAMFRAPFKDKIMPAFREGVLDKMIPPSLRTDEAFTTLWNSTKGMENKAKLLSEAWAGKGAAWAPFQSLKFNFGPNWVAMPREVTNLLVKSKADFLPDMTKGLTGQQVTSLRKIIQNRIDEISGQGHSQKELAKLLEFSEALPGMLKKQVAPGSSQAKLFDDWVENSKAKGDWSRVEKMMNTKGMDEFSAMDFHAAVRPRVREISGELEDFALKASNVLQDFAGNPNIYASLAAISLVGSGVGAVTFGGLGGGVGGGIAALGLTGMMAHPKVQKAVMNNPQLKKAVKEATEADLAKDTKFELVSRILLPVLIAEDVKENR